MESRTQVTLASTAAWAAGRACHQTCEDRSGSFGGIESRDREHLTLEFREKRRTIDCVVRSGAGIAPRSSTENVPRRARGSCRRGTARGRRRDSPDTHDPISAPDWLRSPLANACHIARSTGNSPASSTAMSSSVRAWRTQTVAITDHQRSSRGPTSAPIVAGTNMPSEYQTSKNGAAVSGQ